MKQIIAVDFDGALLSHRPFDTAHTAWFKLMSVLLNDKSINEYAKLDNYFGKVFEVMERYLGIASKETLTLFARNIYAMAVVSEVKKEDLVADFAMYLRKIKPRYALALITSAPELAVEPALEKVGCSSLFDILYKSPMEKQPDKKQLFREFISKYGKPVFYIGNGDKDIESCRELGIHSISVSWVSKGKVKGDYDIASVSELEKIIK